MARPLGAQLGSFFDLDRPDHKWEAYVSVKLIGPDYGTADAQNMAFVDQVLLVEAK